MLSSFAVNWLFLAWTEIYQAHLTVVLGAAIFTGLHYFVGALITSLPEMNVAVEGYSKATRADLNTALSAASVSNMTNLAIAVLGILMIIVLRAVGVELGNGWWPEERRASWLTFSYRCQECRSGPPSRR